MKELFNNNGVSRTGTADTQATSLAERLTVIIDFSVNKCGDLLQSFATVRYSEQIRTLKALRKYVRRWVRDISDGDREFVCGMFMNYYAALHIIHPEFYPLPVYWDNVVRKLGLKCDRNFLIDLRIKNQQH